MLDKSQIINALYDFNPWWKDGLPQEASLHHRKQFKQLLELCPLKQIIIANGIRRTGKTTLLLQIIADLIKNQNQNPKRICRYQFEEGIIKPSADDLELIIRTFIKNILNEDVHTQERVFFFLDELQFVEGWQSIVKKYYDLNENIKFFLTGSSSLFLRKTTRESLAGRTFEEKIPPLSFSEFLHISDDQRFMPIEIPFDLNLINDDYIESSLKSFAVNKEVAPALFEKFMIRGAFPETLKFSSTSLAFRYIRESIVAKVVEYDIPKIYNFRKPDEIAIVLNALAKETGNLLEYKNLASEAGLAINTLKEYIAALQETYLINTLYNYSKKHREVGRQLKKTFIATPNLTCAIHNISESNLVNNPLVGHLAETEVFNRLNMAVNDISFWHKKGKEVDFVLPHQNQLVPIEVKYRNTIKKRDLKEMVAFMKRYDSPFGVIITKNDLKELTIDGNNIIFVPIWMI